MASSNAIPMTAEDIKALREFVDLVGNSNKAARLLRIHAQTMIRAVAGYPVCEHATIAVIKAGIARETPLLVVAVEHRTG